MFWRINDNESLMKESWIAQTAREWAARSFWQHENNFVKMFSQLESIGYKETWEAEIFYRYAKMKLRSEYCLELEETARRIEFYSKVEPHGA